MKNSVPTQRPDDLFEVVEFDGVRYAEIIRATACVDKTRFFSTSDATFQFGLLAHATGFVEPPHCHKPIPRVVRDLPQMLVVQRGRIAIDFFASDGRRLKEILLGPGDGAVLIHGAHSLRVLEDMQCITVKQGPFLGDENDKVLVQTKK